MVLFSEKEVATKRTQTVSQWKQARSYNSNFATAIEAMVQCCINLPLKPIICIQTSHIFHKPADTHIECALTFVKSLCILPAPPALLTGRCNSSTYFSRIKLQHLNSNKLLGEGGKDTAQFKSALWILIYCACYTQKDGCACTSSTN